MQPGQPLPLPSGMLKKHLCPSAVTISKREHLICKAKLPSWTHSFSRKKTAGKQQIDSSPKPSVLAKSMHFSKTVFSPHHKGPQEYEV